MKYRPGTITIEDPFVKLLPDDWSETHEEDNSTLVQYWLDENLRELRNAGCDKGRTSKQKRNARGKSKT